MAKSFNIHIGKPTILKVQTPDEAGCTTPLEYLRSAVARIDFVTEAFQTIEGELASSQDELSEVLYEWLKESEEWLVELGMSNMFTMDVVKIQKPVSGNMEGPLPYLMYNENRSLVIHAQPNPSLESMFEDGEFKIFATGRYWSDGVFQVVRRADWREW